MDEKDSKQPKTEREPELNRPEESIKDLEPDEKEEKDIKGGNFYMKLSV